MDIDANHNLGVTVDHSVGYRYQEDCIVDG